VTMTMTMTMMMMMITVIIMVIDGWWMTISLTTLKLLYQKNCAENTASQSKPLHSEIFMQRNSYTQTLLYTENFTKRNHCTEQFPHAEIVTQRKHCTEQFSHTGVFTQRNRLHRAVFTHYDFTQSGFYTRRFNTQKTLQEHLLHREVFALRHRETLAHRRLCAQNLLYRCT
jgi:hypothetical protein